jgi:SAM-dependent methyltransferase
MQIVGVDIGERMIKYARAQAEELCLTNLRFEIMDCLKPLDFPDNSFDLINARFLTDFMPSHYWRDFLRECRRIVRSGGTIRLTEFEFGTSNNWASEHLTTISIQAMMQADFGFSPDGRHLGVLAMLPRLMRDAGIHIIKKVPYLIDYSYGTEGHEVWYRNLMQLWQLIRPFVLKHQVVSAQEYDLLYDQVAREMLSEAFCAFWTVMTYCGTKL